MEKNRFTPDYISDLGTKEVFVFGSNLLGYHLGGAAATACKYWGARWGVGEGWTSERTYAVPTLDECMERVSFGSLVKSFGKLIDEVKMNSDRVFYLTRVGVGIAGWHIEDVRAALWLAVGEAWNLPDNLVIPWDFYYKEQLQRQSLIEVARAANTPEMREQIHSQIADVENRLAIIWDDIKSRE